MKTINEVIRGNHVARTVITAPKPAVPAELPCQYCGGVKFVRYDLPTDHPNFGKLLPCPECAPKTGFWSDESGLLPEDRALTWDAVKGVSASVVSAKAAIQAAMIAGYGWVYLYGGYGTSKTVLLRTAIAVSNWDGVTGVYTRMSDLFDTIRAAFDGANPQESAIRRLNWFSSVPVLAIDEVEKVSETAFVTERRFQLLDRRYDMATRQRQGVTLIAGNVPPSRLDGAIASRIKDARFTVIEINDTGDLRLVGDRF